MLEPESPQAGANDTDYAELGRRGSAKREANFLERVTQTREELAAHADTYVRRIAEIAESGNDANALKASFGALDRIGVGPHSTQDLNLGLSLVERWAEELEAMPIDPNALGDGA